MIQDAHALPPLASEGKKPSRPHRLHLDRLRSNLGGQPALMPLTYGSKKRKKHWAECRSDERLKTKNVAVIQGGTYEHPTRGTRIDCRGVCSFDFDGNTENGISAEEVAEQFFLLNPPFRWSFRTGADRGFNVWCRVRDDIPRGFNLSDQNGNRVGEFRATGNYTVAQGKHPSGVPYRTIVDLPAITLTDLSTVKWINGDLFSKKGTQDIHIDVRKRFPPLREREDPLPFFSLERERFFPLARGERGRQPQLRELVEKFLPKAPHQTCELHWNLVGEILGSGYQLTPPEQLAVGREWYDAADKRFLRPQLSREDYAKEFLNRFSKRRYAKGGGSEAFDNAVERANQLDPPERASSAYPHDPRVQLIGSLCRELARDSANHRFFLSVRKIQELLESGTPKLGSKLLKDLEAIGLIACVKPSVGLKKANEYLYLLNDFDMEVVG